MGEGGGRPASVKASLSVAFGQRAPNRAGAREQGRGMGAELQGARAGGLSDESCVVGRVGSQRRPPPPLLAAAVANHRDSMLKTSDSCPCAVGKSSGREERPRDRSKDDRREEWRGDYKRHSRSRSREHDRDRRRDDRYGSSARCARRLLYQLIGLVCYLQRQPSSKGA